LPTEYIKGRDEIEVAYLPSQQERIAQTLYVMVIG
jgi:hypothetical protein